MWKQLAAAGVPSSRINNPRFTLRLWSQVKNKKLDGSRSGAAKKFRSMITPKTHYLLHITYIESHISKSRAFSGYKLWPKIPRSKLHGYDGVRQVSGLRMEPVVSVENPTLIPTSHWKRGPRPSRGNSHPLFASSVRVFSAHIWSRILFLSLNAMITSSKTTSPQ